MLTAEIVNDAMQQTGLHPASFVLKRLDEPGIAPIEIDPDNTFYPASMIKTPLALAAYALVQDGALNLTDRFEVVQQNMTMNDKPSPLVPGYVSPLTEILDLMLTRSDNVATNMLYDILGRRSATQIVQDRFGLKNTSFHRKLSGSEPLIHDPEWDRVHMNTHPASDAARLFESIARDEVPFANEFRATLSRQEWKDKLPGGLRPGDRFEHKTGSTDSVTHDGGILYTEDGATYILVVYTGLGSNEENDAKFAPFMLALRPHL